MSLMKEPARFGAERRRENSLGENCERRTPGGMPSGTREGSQLRRPSIFPIGIERRKFWRKNPRSEQFFFKASKHQTATWMPSEEPNGATQERPTAKTPLLPTREAARPGGSTRAVPAGSAVGKDLRDWRNLAASKLTTGIFLV
jgi:hypothetical protein